MKKHIKKIIEENDQIERRRLAIVLKGLDILKEAVEEEVGSEPEDFKEMDIRCEVWKAYRYLENFFK